MKALLIILILLSALILGVAIGVRCHRRLAKKQALPKISDGSVISMKYNGMGEKKLFELLKSFL